MQHDVGPRFVEGGEDRRARRAARRRRRPVSRPSSTRVEGRHRAPAPAATARHRCRRARRDPRHRRRRRSTRVTATPSLTQRLGDAQRALQMADAEQILDVEEDAPVTRSAPAARLSRSTAGRPSRVEAEQMRRRPDEPRRRLAAHVPAGRQGEDGADHALVGDRAGRRAGRGDLGEERRDPACTSRGLSPPGGRKSSPSFLRLAISAAEPWRADSARVSPSHSPQSISISRGSTPARRRRAAAPFRPRGAAGSSARRNPASSGGRRQSAASRAGRAAVSARPCRRPASFHSVGHVADQREQGHAARARVSAAMISSSRAAAAGEVVLAPAPCAVPRPPSPRGARRVGEQRRDSGGEGVGVARRRRAGRSRRRATMSATPPLRAGDHRQRRSPGLRAAPCRRPR